MVGLVYIAAFGPDEGDSLSGIFARRDQPSGATNITPDSKGFLWIKYDEFRQSFCQDLDEDMALVMSLSQRPIHSKCFADASGLPAWRTKPSWYQVSDQDHMILPATEQEMAERMNAKKVIHLDASHASLASHPKEVSALILEAAATLE